MDIRITKKDLQSNYYYIVKAGYCEFQTLLRNVANEVGYARGVYGWNWTAYEVLSSNSDRVVVCTGYRDMTGKRIKGLGKFEQKAKKIWDWDNPATYISKQKQAKNLAKKFADYVVEHYNLGV